MLRTHRRPGPLGVLTLLGTLIVQPACSASAGHRSARAAADCPPGSARTAYRPVYSALMRPKTLFLSNYAGAQYPPATPQPAPTATSYRPGRHRPFGFLFGGAGE